MLVRLKGKTDPEEDESRRGAAAGMSDYVAKPLKPKRLIEMIDRWLAEPESSQVGGAVTRAAPVEEPRQGGAVGNFQVERESQPGERGMAQVPSGEDVFNRAELLRRLMHDEELVEEIIEEFLKDVPQRIAALREALSRGDSPLVQREAHTLKGAASNVSAVALHKLALETERAGASAELDKVASLIARIDEQFEILKKTVTCLGARAPVCKA